MIDIIITKFFPLCFNMAESFENLDNILCDWVKEKIQKVLSRHWTVVRSRKKKKKAISFLKNDSEKILQQCQSAESSKTKPNTKLDVKLTLS